MKRVGIILAAGVKESKACKAEELLKDELQKIDISAEITYVNTYEHNDLSDYEEGMDLVVVAGPGKLTTVLPIVQGLGIIYPWMGLETLLQEIKKYASN